MRAGVWALGTDRPGIVAAVTGAVVEAGGNLADTAMEILSGQFAMVLIVDNVVSLDALRVAVADAGASLGITTAVQAIEEGASGEPAGATCMVSVHGADRPGIVHSVATLLAERHVNIVDLRTHVIGTADAPVYTMLIEAELPSDLVSDALDAAVRGLAAELGIDAHVHAVDDDLL